MTRTITPHKGGRKIKKSLDVTPATAAAIAHLATQGVSLGDLVEWAAKEKLMNAQTMDELQSEAYRAEYQSMVDSGTIHDGDPVIFGEGEDAVIIRETFARQMHNLVLQEIDELKEIAGDVEIMADVAGWELRLCRTSEGYDIVDTSGVIFASGSVSELRAHINAYRQIASRIICGA